VHPLTVASLMLVLADEAYETFSAARPASWTGARGGGRGASKKLPAVTVSVDDGSSDFEGFRITIQVEPGKRFKAKTGSLSQKWVDLVALAAIMPRGKVEAALASLKGVYHDTVRGPPPRMCPSSVASDTEATRL
jgi:hypothetical protein